MPRQTHLSPEFIELAPPKLTEGVLYVSMVHSCVIHQCCCGCGEKVVTPLSPGEWQLSYDGKAVTLYPSIGNSRFPCGSHYWIRSGKVVWAPKLSAAETETARLLDRAARDAHFSSRSVTPAPAPQAAVAVTENKPGFWRRLFGSR
jgi:hypothetical protein